MNICAKKLEKKAHWVRRQVLEIISRSGRGHIGGAFSCVDILVALYYGGILRRKTKHPDWPKRDRFILSKGHSGSALYVILADLGYFSLKELNHFGHNDSLLGGHPDRNIPGIEADTGSLGHGLGIGSGLALSSKMDRSDSKTFVLLGDGECYEGSVWEAAMFAGHHQLNHLVAIVDRNCQCVTDFTEDCCTLENFAKKWEAFNWEVKVIDGHSMKALLNVLSAIKGRRSKKPLAIIAHTVKGKGVSFMEKNIEWHHRVPKGECLTLARKELE